MVSEGTPSIMDGKYGGEGHEAAGHSSSTVACKERKGLLVLLSVSEFLPGPQPMDGATHIQGGSSYLS